VSNQTKILPKGTLRKMKKYQQKKGISAFVELHQHFLMAQQ